MALYPSSATLLAEAGLLYIAVLSTPDIFAKPVSVAPGNNAVTVMSLSYNSSAMALLKDETYALEAK